LFIEILSQLAFYSGSGANINMLIDEVQKLMPNFFLTWFVTAISLMITAYIVPGFVINSFAALIAAVVLWAG